MNGTIRYATDIRVSNQDRTDNEITLSVHHAKYGFRHGKFVGIDGVSEIDILDLPSSVTNTLKWALRNGGETDADRVSRLAVRIGEKIEALKASGYSDAAMPVMIAMDLLGLSDQEEAQ